MVVFFLFLFKEVFIYLFQNPNKVLGLMCVIKDDFSNMLFYDSSTVF